MPDLLPPDTKKSDHPKQKNSWVLSAREKKHKKPSKQPPNFGHKGLTRSLQLSTVISYHLQFPNANIWPFNKGQVVTPCITTNKGPILVVFTMYFLKFVFGILFRSFDPKDFCQASLPQPSSIPPNLSYFSVCQKKRQTSQKNNSWVFQKNGSPRFSDVLQFFHVESGSGVMFF